MDQIRIEHYSCFTEKWKKRIVALKSSAKDPAERQSLDTPESLRFRQAPFEYGSQDAEDENRSHAGDHGDQFALLPEEGTDERADDGGAGVKMLHEDIGAVPGKQVS